jgi:hypothetical protein
MRVERTTTGKRIQTTTLTEESAWSPDVGVGNPKFFDHPVHVSLGHDADGRSVELRLTRNDAARLLAALSDAIARVDDLADDT